METFPSFGLRLPDAIRAPESGADPLLERHWPEPPHPYRPPLVRDIGRILHARAFRRLAGKTQVFTRRSEESDHSRSRLTHTLEVAQIARTAAATLGLNASLAEALALVHDIGHPPFGHAGEKALDAALRHHGLGFDHNLHALRIVTLFEERYAAFPGLNLTLAVREGILKHSRDLTSAAHPELAGYLLDQRPPLEAQLIDLVDEIAYLAADFEDGLAAGVLSLNQVIADVPLVSGFYLAARQQFPAAESRLLTNEALKQMLNHLVSDMMEETVRQVRQHAISTLSELRRCGFRIAAFSPPVERERRHAKAFLYDHLYQSELLEIEHQHANQIVSTLFSAWVADPSLLPFDHQARVEEEGAPRAVADYLAGMTDSYIEQAWRRHQRRQSEPL